MQGTMPQRGDRNGGAIVVAFNGQQYKNNQ